MTTTLFKSCKFRVKRSPVQDVDILSNVTDLGFKIVEIEPNLVIEKESTSDQNILQLVDVLKKSRLFRYHREHSDSREARKTGAEIVETEDLSTKLLTHQIQGGPNSLKGTEDGNHEGISCVYHQDKPSSGKLLTQDLNEGAHQLENLTLSQISCLAKTSHGNDYERYARGGNESQISSKSYRQQQEEEGSFKTDRDAQNVGAHSQEEENENSVIAEKRYNDQLCKKVCLEKEQQQMQARFGHSDKSKPRTFSEGRTEETAAKPKWIDKELSDEEITVQDLDQNQYHCLEKMEKKSGPKNASDERTQALLSSTSTVKEKEPNPRYECGRNGEEYFSGDISTTEKSTVPQNTLKSFESAHAMLKANENKVQSQPERKHSTSSGDQLPIAIVGENMMEDEESRELQRQVVNSRERKQKSKLRNMVEKDDSDSSYEEIPSHTVLVEHADVKKEAEKSKNGRKTEDSLAVDEDYGSFMLVRNEWPSYLRGDEESLYDSVKSLDSFNWTELKQEIENEDNKTDLSEFSELNVKDEAAKMKRVESSEFGDNHISCVLSHLDFQAARIYFHKSKYYSFFKRALEKDKEFLELELCQDAPDEMEFFSILKNFKTQKIDFTDGKCAEVIAEMVMSEFSDIRIKIYGSKMLVFGPDTSVDTATKKINFLLELENPMEPVNSSPAKMAISLVEENMEKQRERLPSDAVERCHIVRKKYENNDESDQGEESMFYSTRGDTSYDEFLSDKDKRLEVANQKCEINGEVDEQAEKKAGFDTIYDKYLFDKEKSDIDMKKCENSEESKEEKKYKVGADMSYDESPFDRDESCDIVKEKYEDYGESNEQKGFKAGVDTSYDRSFSQTSLSENEGKDAETLSPECYESDLSDESYSQDGPLFYTGPNNGLRIHIHAADITKLDVDAIVCATDSRLSFGGSVSGAIAKAAGPALLKDCQTFLDTEGFLDVTDVFVSDGGNMPARYVLHASGPQWDAYRDKKKCADDVRRTVLRCLLEAGRLGLTSVALPSISAAFRVPKDICAKSYMYAVKHLDAFKEKEFKYPLKEIHFVDLDHGMVDTIKGYFMNHWEQPWDSHLIEEDFDFASKHIMSKESGKAVGGCSTSTCDALKQKIQKIDMTGIDHISPFHKKRIKMNERNRERHLFPEEQVPTKTESRRFDDNDSETREFQSKNSFQKTTSPDQGSESFQAPADLDKKGYQHRNTEVKCISGFERERVAIPTALPNEEANSSEDYRIRDILMSVNTKSALDYEADIVFLIGELFDKLSAEPGFKAKDCIKQCDDMPGQENSFKFNLLPLPKKAKPQMLCIINPVPDGPEDVTQAVINFEAALRAVTLSGKIPVKSIVLTSKILHTDQSTGRGANRLVSKFAMSIFEWVDKASLDIQLSTETVFIAASETAMPILIKVLDSAGVKKIHKPLSAGIRQSVGPNLECPICTMLVSSMKVLSCCGKWVCKSCKQKLAHCPHCRQPFETSRDSQSQEIKDYQQSLETSRDSQPSGSMHVFFLPDESAAGYEGCGVYEIIYEFPDGLQGRHDPRPGRKYQGGGRTAYIPATSDGLSVLKLLRLAFLRGLTFRVGTSQTTGKTNVITWADIPHKTKLDGGGFGYPDPTYLIEVIPTLADKGVTRSSMNNEEKLALACFASSLRKKQKFIDD